MYKCCGRMNADGGAGGFPACADRTKTDCLLPLAEGGMFNDPEWCGDTPDTALKPAAIAAIAATPVFLIAAAAGVAL